MVSIGSITYLGSHGAERLESGWTESVLDPALEEWVARVEEFRLQSDTAELRRRRVRIEDKGPIVAFHWRGAVDEPSARAAIDALAAQAQEAGFEVHWGRKVMEARPPVRIDKGAGIAKLLERHRVANALYGGDDTTDLDAFRTLKQLAVDGVLEHAVCVGVRSDDGPREIEEAADLVVDGTGGMLELLAALLTE
jgi:trehalose 6-phosphate phosphatase